MQENIVRNVVAKGKPFTIKDLLAAGCRQTLAYRVCDKMVANGELYVEPGPSGMRQWTRRTPDLKSVK